MKKTYQNPEIDTIGMSLEDIIAASPVENGFNMNEPIGETSATSGNLSRRSIWDDEDGDEVLGF